MNRPLLRIGTRNSKLALWQAHNIQSLLHTSQVETELVPIVSDGEKNLTQPIYEMGITGVFTKALDIALLNNQIDCAIHSMKDVPVLLPQGIVQAAVLERGRTEDVLVRNEKNLQKGAIASGSLRRQKQWLFRYPKDEVVELRGNIQTRIDKINQDGIKGGILAAVALERLDIMPQQVEVLDWMVPAPAQGALLLVCRENDEEVREILSAYNHSESDYATQIERDFLHRLEGGCSAPIGASAKIENGKVTFVGTLHSMDAKKQWRVEKQWEVGDTSIDGNTLAEELLKQKNG